MNQNQKHVVMVASENGALSGGKVGGVGDVIRELPIALEQLGWHSTVIIPSYGFLQVRNSTSVLRHISFPFRGSTGEAEIRKVELKEEHPGITHLLVDHPDIAGSPIYFNDPPATPFLRDAAKYALFCSVVGQYLKTIHHPFILHLHDWHAATMLLLAELHPGFSHLRELHTVFTIHNLSIQGTRPMRKSPSSLQHWFPELFEKDGWVSLWKDPRYAEPCYTPMAAGIRFADKVNTVSPAYAEEILQPSDPQSGLYRGEGLEEFLQNASAGKRLVGILNGCDYPAATSTAHLSYDDFVSALLRELEEGRLQGGGETLDEVVFRLRQLRNSTPGIVMTCVTRIVEQKVRLFFEEGSDGLPVLGHLVRMLEARNGILIVLGQGILEYEKVFNEYFEEHSRIIFIHGYSDAISRLLYANGDLFLMPSLFEPCGISQMFAMREGQPCIVHATGGLKDTVSDMKNGFSFEGRSLVKIADNFTGTLEKAMNIFEHDKPLWESICEHARASRFTWEKSARQYEELLYATGDGG